MTYAESAHYNQACKTSTLFEGLYNKPISPTYSRANTIRGLLVFKEIQYLLYILLKTFLGVLTTTTVTTAGRKQYYREKPVYKGHLLMRNYQMATVVGYIGQPDLKLGPPPQAHTCAEDTFSIPLTKGGNGNVK